MSIVTLVSGGMDSSLMSYLAHSDGIRQHPLFIDYGQLSSAREKQTCVAFFGEFNLPEVTAVDLSGYGKLIPSGITDNKKDIYQDAFLPGRNSLFLLTGASYAFRVGADAVAIGLLHEQTHLFPDQTQEYVVLAEHFLAHALGRRIKIITPLSEFSKQDVIDLAKQHGLHGKTYSCHSGNATPCGICVSCKEIMAAKQRR